MFSLSKGLFILLGLVCFGHAAENPEIKVSLYAGAASGIDTVIYIGPEVPKEKIPQAPSAYPTLYQDLAEFEKVCVLNISFSRLLQ